MNWIVSRMKEPSIYAALGAVVVAIGVIISQPIIIALGIFTVGGVVGFLLAQVPVCKCTSARKKA